MWKKIKLILSSVREYKKYAFITPIFMIFEALIECVMPFIMSALIDSVNDNVTELNTFSDIFKVITYTNKGLGFSINVPGWSFSYLWNFRWKNCC